MGQILRGIWMWECSERTPDEAMSNLTAEQIGNELLRDTIATNEQLTTGLTVLGLTAAMHPEQCPRVRKLHEDLLALLQRCENDLGLDDPLGDWRD